MIPARGPQTDFLANSGSQGSGLRNVLAMAAPEDSAIHEEIRHRMADDDRVLGTGEVVRDVLHDHEVPGPVRLEGVVPAEPHALLSA